jgi:hypothetical protein
VNGTIPWAGESVADIGAPMLTALSILAVAAVASAAASTTTLLGMVVPMSLPILATGEVMAPGFLTALAVSVSLVEFSPFSTGGAIYMANAPKQARPLMNTGLLQFTVTRAIVRPVASWLAFVVPNWA